MKQNFNIGLKINELRKNKFLSKKDFMVKLEKTPSLFNKWETLPDCDTGILREICENFDVDIMYFFDDQNAKTKPYKISQKIGYISENSTNYSTQQVSNETDLLSEVVLLRNMNESYKREIQTLERLITELQKNRN